MTKSVRKFTRKNVKVEFKLDPPIGGCGMKNYYAMSDRCQAIKKLLRPMRLSSIDFGNPYTYASRPVKNWAFEVDEKVWLRGKRKLDLLKKILGGKKMKALGLGSFRIRKVKETVVTTREFTEA